MSSRKYYYYRGLIGDLSETFWRPTCMIGDLDIFHLRLTGPFGNRLVLLETDMPAESNRNFNTFKYSCFTYFLLIYIYWNNILGHDGFRWVSDEACWSLTGLRWVSDDNNIFVNSYFVDINCYSHREKQSYRATHLLVMKIVEKRFFFSVYRVCTIMTTFFRTIHTL